MAGFVFAMMVEEWKEDKPLLPGVTLTVALALGFFLFLELFLANAFERTDFPPPMGAASTHCCATPA